MQADRLEDVYFDVPAAQRRFHEIGAVFAANFGTRPDFVVRSPGRVNIIGDHVDYSLFPCLPAAIAFDVVMAVEVVRGGRTVELLNTDPRFPTYEFAAAADARIDAPGWFNYFKCGWITALRHLGLREPHGLRVVVSGNVPAGGGLSSSAAFVVTACLVTILAHSPRGSLPISKQALTALSATCEQLVGVNSGGLDQAASVFGEKDHALLVSFRPELQARPLQFPVADDPVVFLIANSLVVSEKLQTAPIHYNLRVVEVTLAARVLARRLGVSIPADGNLDAGTLHGVLEAKYKAVSPQALEQMVADVKQHLSAEPYTAQQVCTELGIDEAELKRTYLTRFPVRFERLKLQQRALHVYEETLRVLQFVDTMASGDVARLGQLMNESQASAETQYENSHPDCDRLCRIARAAGALGSRVTGAGWGGCTVHLVLRSNAAAVRAAIESEYYEKHHPEAPSSALVDSRPGAGTAVFWDAAAVLNNEN